MRMVKAKAIGLQTFNFHGFPAEMAWLNIWISLGDIVLFYEIGIVGLKINDIAMHLAAHVENCACPGAGSIFPFRLGKQAISVGSPVPSHGLPINYIRWLQSAACTERIAVANGIQPGNIFYREPIAHVCTGIIAHQSFEVFLRNFERIHVEGTYPDIMLNFIRLALTF